MNEGEDYFAQAKNTKKMLRQEKKEQQKEKVFIHDHLFLDDRFSKRTIFACFI